MDLVYINVYTNFYQNSSICSEDNEEKHIFTSIKGRAAMIHSPHDTIRIAILASRYDTYRDTLFRLEIISNCMRLIL